MNQTEQHPSTPNQPSGHYISRNQLSVAIGVGVALVLALVFAAGAALGSTSTASGNEALPPVVVPSTEPPPDTAPTSTEPPIDSTPPSTEPPAPTMTTPPPSTEPPPPTTLPTPPTTLPTPPTTLPTPPPPTTLPTLPTTLPTTPPLPPPTTLPTTPPPPLPTTPPPPELAQIVVQVTDIVGEASLHLDGSRIAGTGDSFTVGAESIAPINLTDRLQNRPGTLVLDFWKFPCWNAEVNIEFFVDGRLADKRSMRECDGDLNWSWDVDPIAGTVTRT